MSENDTGLPTGLNAKLVGELIGVARATDGSEHLITPQLTKDVRELLTIAGKGTAAPDDITRAIEAKRSIVPGCFTCTNPCGRTFAYDLQDLKNKPADIRIGKELAIVSAIRLAGSDSLTPEQEKLIYQGLIAGGLDGIDRDVLFGLLEAMNR